MKFSLSNPGAHEAYLISWVSLALTGIAFVVGLIVATSSNSSATLGFALENAVDGISSALVLWRFWGGGHSIPVAELELREKRASVGIALAFVVLAVTVGGTASAHISEHSVPSNVEALLGVSAPSVVVFAVLGAIKLHLGFATHSPSLKKDAACSLCARRLQPMYARLQPHESELQPHAPRCGALLSLGVCIGTAVAHEAWWFDAVVALLVSGALLLHARQLKPLGLATVRARAWARAKAKGGGEVEGRGESEGADEGGRLGLGARGSPRARGSFG